MQVLFLLISCLKVWRYKENFKFAGRDMIEKVSKVLVPKRKMVSEMFIKIVEQKVFLLAYIKNVPSFPSFATDRWLANFQA